MEKKILIVGLMLLFNLQLHAQNDEKKVIETFDHYKSAILNDRGKEALKYISNKTIKYYTDILEVTKNGDSAAVSSSSLLDKLTVLTIRHRAGREELSKMNGSMLFVYAIEKGMIGKNSVISLSIGKVLINKDFARGQIVTDGEAAPAYFHFYKESGEWKIDLASLFPLANLTLKEMINESGEDENEYILSLLEIITGKKPGSEIWHAMN